MSIQQIVEEVGNIADLLRDTPIYFSSRQSAEGIEAMIQAATSFNSAATDAERLHAALWVGEAYLIFSNSLPDTGDSEHSTSWATANQISKLLGGPHFWEKKVRSEYS